MEIYKTFIFHAAHRMTNMPKGHEYSKIHGHSFTVDIYVKGSTVGVCSDRLLENGAKRVIQLCAGKSQ